MAWFHGVHMEAVNKLRDADFSMTFEVLIPVRNATEVFDKTIESLAGQTDKNFSVFISDNFSTTGQQHIADALTKLSEAGITARKIQPPSELGRVEHWNWLHYQSSADWLKPLFAGDWLEPDYVAAVRAAANDARCAYVYCGYAFHHASQTQTSVGKWTGRFFTAEEMQEVVLRYAMQFGPPSVAAYRRDVFVQAGGYDPRLPICADSLLFCKLAARHGAYGVDRVCAHFFIHPARFSDTLGTKQRAAFREGLRYMADLGLTAWHERWRFPKLGYLRLLAREVYHRRKLL
jgi:glycosyltransferase involved in cell wall biosynthesis